MSAHTVFGLHSVSHRRPVDAERHERDQLGEDPRIAQLFVDGEAERGVVESGLGRSGWLPGRMQEDELFGPRRGKEPEDDGVHHAECRRVRADAERERHGDDNREEGSRRT